jgi:hypothetical protein
MDEAFSAASCNRLVSPPSLLSVQFPHKALSLLLDRCALESSGNSEIQGSSQLGEEGILYNAVMASITFLPLSVSVMFTIPDRPGHL